MLKTLDHVRGDLLQQTVQRFGFEALHSVQEQIITEHIAGRNVVGILPTGKGKSACFQIPSIVCNRRTIVVSPLISLQTDQVQSLRRKGFHAFALHSQIPELDRTAIRYFYRTRNHLVEPSFLYISPEMFTSDAFYEAYKDFGFTALAVDEAHCVSTWGNTFRPDYQRLSIAARRFGITLCSAFTATADDRIEEDMRSRLPLGEDVLVVRSDPYRENLTLRAHRYTQPRSSKKHGLLRQRLVVGEIVSEPKGGARIVYCNTRDLATVLYCSGYVQSALRKHGYTPYLYHAEVPYDDKVEAFNGFTEDERPVVFATSAFGMGIDRVDVRKIIHIGLPITLIDYAQQIGRAGRDGAESICTSIFNPGALDGLEGKVRWQVPTLKFVESVHRRAAEYVAKREGKGKATMNIRSYLSQVVRITELSPEHFTNAKQYNDHFTHAMAILQRLNIVTESRNCMEVRAVPPGSPLHLRLVEETKMHERMQVREKKRLIDFYGTPELDQAHLWRILQQR